MSLPKKITVKCSKCGAEIEATIFESINTDYATDIVDKITSGDIFNVKCTKCGFVSQLEYDFLYHDIKHGAMIWVLHENSAEYEKKISELKHSENILQYKTTRIVNSINTLREKITCLENNRDDKIIELCKVFIKYNLLSKQPDFDFDYAFYTTFLDKERVFLYDKSGEELSCELTEEAYSLLYDLYYNSKYASIFEDYYAIVDHDWAEETLYPLLKQESDRIDAKNAAESAGTNNTVSAENKVVCPKCKQTLPEDSVFCHYCGTAITSTTFPSEVRAVNIEKSNVYTYPTPPSYQANVKSKKESSKKALICILLVILLCCAGWLGYNYFSFTKAIDNEDFIKAERYFDVIPFGENLLPAQNEYLNAGVLWEEGKYIEAYQAFKKIESTSVPSSIITELETKIYSLGQSAYKTENYTQAEKYFNAIPNYKKSSDYLLLIDCRGDTFSAWSKAQSNYSKLIKLLNNNFENVDEIILENDSLLETFLTGRWENGNRNNPYYFEIYENGDGLTCKYNLPCKEADGYFWISDGMYKVGETESSAIKIYRFNIIDEDTVSVYCFKDGSTHKLYRQ